ncbi:MAG: ribosomal-protein-alanine N-acetyltransferase [Chloroflexi bacterium]|nr:MAG: ribosomal-protein-alanine N-acetyltransferase [Chloroflexota bacterium]
MTLPVWLPSTYAIQPGNRALLSAPPFYCRAMQASDMADVLAIDAVSFPTPMKQSLLRYELFENTMAHYQILVQHQALDGGAENERMVGFAGYWLMGDEVHISTIAVLPDWRGRHLGEFLLLNMLFLASAHPVCLMTLEVRRSNVAAQQLYQKYQFARVGERLRYYKDTGEDAILMTVTPLNGRYQQFLLAQKRTLLSQIQTEA